jgi:hypothetical protein
MSDRGLARAPNLRGTWLLIAGVVLLVATPGRRMVYAACFRRSASACACELGCLLLLAQAFRVSASSGVPAVAVAALCVHLRMRRRGQTLQSQSSSLSVVVRAPSPRSGLVGGLGARSHWRRCWTACSIGWAGVDWRRRSRRKSHSRQWTSGGGARAMLFGAQVACAGCMRSSSWRELDSHVLSQRGFM